MSIGGGSEEESWIKDASSARDGAEKVTRLVGENRGEGADVCCVRSPGRVSRLMPLSLTTQAVKTLL